MCDIVLYVRQYAARYITKNISTKEEKMDVQMKRGLLEVCVLRSLYDSESYGYQIIKDVSPYVSISESTLYPILRRLEASSLVSVRSAEHNGRLRKYYRITALGVNKLNAFISEWKEINTIYRYVTEGGHAV